MRLYKWSSGFLADYSNGTIVVMAENVEDARKKAYEYFLKEYVLDDEAFGVECYVNGYDDEFYGRMLIESREKFLHDINKEPEETDGVVFIEGCS